MFAPGVTEMTGRVLLKQDGEAEKDEYFAVNRLHLPISGERVMFDLAIFLNTSHIMRLEALG